MAVHTRKTTDLALVEKAPPGLRARELFEEARKASLDHLRDLATAIDQVRALSEVVVDAGDLYDPGIRDLAQRLAEDLTWRGRTLEKLAALQVPRAAAEPAREVG